MSLLYALKPRWLEHQWLVYHSDFKHVLETLDINIIGIGGDLIFLI